MSDPTETVDADGSEADGGKGALSAPWYPPLPLWKLFFLIFLTFGVYTFFYIYRCARELRDHANPQLKPGLYPWAIPFGIVAAVAIGRLAGEARGLAAPEDRFAGAYPALVSGLLLISHVVLASVDYVTFLSMILVGLALHTVPWLLLQRQLNLVKLAIPDAEFRSRPNRYTNLQWVGLGVGTIGTLLVAVGVWQDVVRWKGHMLAANEFYVDSAGRFSIRPPRDDWVLIEPGYLGDDTDLELLGPGPSDWAVVYVHERSGWTVDQLVESRYDEMVNMSASSEEVRRLLPGSEIPMSYARYTGANTVDGMFVYDVTTFTVDERGVEMIVFTAGTSLVDGQGAAFAASLRPLPADPEAP